MTAEQFYLANSQPPSYGARGQTPSMVVSLRGLEFLTRLPASEIGSRLLGILADERALDA